MKQTISDGAKKLGIDITDQSADALIRYFNILVERNKSVKQKFLQSACDSEESFCRACVVNTITLSEKMTTRHPFRKTKYTVVLFFTIRWYQSKFFFLFATASTLKEVGL